MIYFNYAVSATRSFLVKALGYLLAALFFIAMLRFIF